MSGHPEIFRPRHGVLKLTPQQRLAHSQRRQLRPGMVWIEGGRFCMGSDHHYPEESPAHYVAVGDFWIDRVPVTNLEFARFVAATGYVTVAERWPRPQDYPAAWAKVTRDFRVLTSGLVRAASSPLRGGIVPLAARAPWLYSAAVERLAR